MDNSQSSLLFPSVGGKPIVAAFDGGDLSSDGGMLLLSAADRKVCLTTSMASAIGDTRQLGKVQHTLLALLQERIFAIASGYEDANDLNDLRKDPALKVACSRKPSGEDLASQPTISRLENSLGARDLLQLGKAIARRVVAQLPESTEQIILDVDATDDPCHGQQELDFFNGHYGSHCYLPLYLYVTASIAGQSTASNRNDSTASDGQQRLLATLLRSGKSAANTGLRGLLRIAIRLIRERFPKARLILRADSGFGIPKVLDFCERHCLDYVLGLSGYLPLHQLSEAAQMRAAVRYTFECKLAGIVCREFDSFAYKAQTWPWPRRVVVKAEVTQGELNPRFVLTNRIAAPEEIYELYCQRGDSENRIKEMKLDLASGRTSCHRFWANQFRLLLHTAASVLVTCLQATLKNITQSNSLWGGAQTGTVRTKLLKVAARFSESWRRIRVQLPSSFPYKEIWQQLHLRLCVT
jgi:hypothetical protein